MSTKALGITIDRSMKFTSQLEIARGSLIRKWNMLKPYINNGLNMTVTRKILTTVILPKACYGSHIWDQQQRLSIYQQLKDLLRVPYHPAQELLHALSGLLPLDLQHRRNRLSTLRQLITTDNIGILSSNSKSRLSIACLTDLKSIGGKEVTMTTATAGCLKRSRIAAVIVKESHRRWNSYINRSNVTSAGSLHKYDILKFSSEAAAPIKVIGQMLSLFSGQCDLQLFRYKIGLSYTPTCACLEDDETPWHFMFECPIYKVSRAYHGVRPDMHITEIENAIAYLHSTRRLCIHMVA